MKQEDFDRLKALCQENDFEIDGYHPTSRLFIIDKKDPWDGVEFAQLVNYIPTTSTIQNQFTSGKIYRISRIYGSDYKRLEVKEDDSGRLNGLDLLKFKPSTESAYVEQLKKEAFERFGEIKEGQSFIDVASGVKLKVEHSFSGFVYSKVIDSLCIGGVIIYYKGKWATKVKERVKTDFQGHLSVGNYDSHLHQFSIGVSRNSNQFDPEKAGKFLAKQLEAYLNGEIE